MKKKCRILLIGGNGFIGSHLQDCLLKEEYNVRVFDRSRELFRKPLKHVDYFNGDISDICLLEKAIAGCDLVIYLAHSPAPRNDIDFFYDEASNNLEDFTKFLRVVSKSSVEKIVYFSSGGTVYGQPQEIPTPEDHQLKPISSYGAVKVAMEIYLNMYCHHHDKEYLVVRPANPYGPRQNYRGSQGVISIFMHHILNNKPLNIWGSGEIRKDYIYVEDLARATVSLMQSGVKNQVFNLGSGVGISLLEIVSLIEKVTGKLAILKKEKSLNTDIRHFILDCTKFHSFVGEKPATTGLTDGVKATYRWLKDENFK